MLFFAAEEPNGVHLAGDINEVIWGSLAFFVLLALVIWKGGPAIKKAFVGRTERIRSELAHAHASRQEAESALTESTADLPDVDEEADRIRSDAAETAERLKVDIVAKAGEEALTMRERATADIENQKRQALADIREEVATLTRGATEVVVNDSLDDAAHADLIENYISQVGQLS